MPELAAAGPISLVAKNLQALIASASWFQSWTGTANQAAAEARVLIGEYDAGPDDDDPAERPFCVIRSPRPEFRPVGVNTRTTVWRTTIVVEGAADEDYANEPVNARMERDNAFGQFAAMLGSQSGQAVLVGGDTRLVFLEEITPDGDGALWYPRKASSDNRADFERWSGAIEVVIGV